jgi:predicted DNA-binding WGR domain protein
MHMVCICRGHEKSKAFMLTMYNEELITLWGRLGARSQTEFQHGDRQPEVVFLLNFSRRRRDFSTETDFRRVAEFTAITLYP